MIKRLAIKAEECSETERQPQRDCAKFLYLFHFFVWPFLSTAQFKMMTMISVLPKGRSRWFVIFNVSSRSWEWYEQRGSFSLYFLCRQWDMNGLSRAAHMRRNFYTLAFTSLSTIEWLNSYAQGGYLREWQIFFLLSPNGSIGQPNFVQDQRSVSKLLTK